ncbi:unnamed protein product [Acanthosepion pharaonis]|uniref:F5/8 type C domain-containing protein n=1 Tax=Acanthosepion pharaonis TaxID=158019 RepID=A0A812ETX5_ACAPH|nr:unnamed protein product [Sepia pharaonis]
MFDTTPDVSHNEPVSGIISPFKVQKFLSFFFSLLCRQGSPLGDQTPSFLHLFSSRPPGNYTFLLRLLKGENLLKHVVKRFLKTHVFAPSSQTALAPNLIYEFLFNFSGLLRADFSKLSLKGKLALSNFVTHASFLYGQTLPAFSSGREKQPPVSKRSRFQLLLRSNPSSPFPFKKGAEGTRVRVSSVLNKDVKQYGKKYLFDGKDETCWNSSEGSPQWILIDLERSVEVEELVIRFQGGFAGQDCWIEGSVSEDSSCLQMLQKIYPEDNSSQQISLICFFLGGGYF